MAEEIRKAREEAKADVAKLREDLLAKAKAEQEALIKQGRAQIQAETRPRPWRKCAATRRPSWWWKPRPSCWKRSSTCKDTDLALAEKLVAAVKAPKISYKNYVGR